MKISLSFVFLLFSTVSAETTINGVVGKLEFTDEMCGSEGTAAQCPVGGGDLCSNNMCATTTGSCNSAGDGCLTMMDAEEACVEPANKCGDGFCGTPPVYSDCQCKDNKCYKMKFVPGDGSGGSGGDGGGGDATVTQTQSESGEVVDSTSTGGSAAVSLVLLEPFAYLLVGGAALFL